MKYHKKKNSDIKNSGTRISGKKLPWLERGGETERGRRRGPDVRLLVNVGVSRVWLTVHGETLFYSFPSGLWRHHTVCVCVCVCVCVWWDPVCDVHVYGLIRIVFFIYSQPIGWRRGSKLIQGQWGTIWKTQETAVFITTTSTKKSPKLLNHLLDNNLINEEVCWSAFIVNFLPR